MLNEQMAADLAWNKEALAAAKGKLDAVWEGVREAVEKYTGQPCEGEPFDRLNELLARLERRATEARCWRPIETAPRDGRTMLIRFGLDGVSQQAKYIEGLQYPWKYLNTNDGVLWTINYAKDGSTGPTHWMSVTGPTSECTGRGPDEAELRAEFVRQHPGRDLQQHRLRGTYSSPPIAALWNQHLRTADWMTRRAAFGALVAPYHKETQS